MNLKLNLKGTPHWFQNVPGPIDYYAVKVR